MTDLIGQKIDHFRIERLLGQGGMGVVYEATDLSLNRRVALKIMHKHLAARESFQQRFVREAQNAARLKHPNIVQIHHFFNRDGQLFLVMELLENGSLQDYMQRLRDQGRRMEQAEAVELVRQVASGLHYAHQQGMIHRDIKPANVLLTTDTDGNNPFTAYRALIADFGLAKLLQEMQTSQTGPVGTLAYMAPEQILGGRVDARSDIYALGVILFELVLGYRPFNPQSLRDAVRAHRGGSVLTPANTPPGLPAALEEVINRCLASNPEDRYQSAHEVAHALRQFLESDEVRQRSPLPEESAPAPPPPAPARMPPEEANLLTHVTNPTWPHAAPSMYPDVERSDLYGHDLLMISYKSQQLDPIPIRQDIITIGRDPTNHIALQGTKSEVSRHHARIERNPEGGYYIIDLNSTNGTFMGRQKLTPSVPQFWEPDKTVRIGDYWLKIDLVANRGARASRQGDGRTQPNTQNPLTEEFLTENIAVQASLTHVIVEAGSYNDITVAVTNRSKYVDHYALQVMGLPPEWVVLPDRQLKLLPDKQDTLTVRLHPPRSSESRAGQHRFTLRIVSVKDASVYMTIPCTLEINPFYQFSASLQPRLIHRDQPLILTIINEGNSTDYYTLSASDNQYALTFDLPTEPLMVEPAQGIDVQIDVASRSQPIVGSTRILPFDIQVASKGQGAGAKSVSGALQVDAMIPRLVFGAAVALGLLGCIAVTLLAIGLAGSNQNANATATAEAERTRQTAEAGVDSDNDGLTDARELELDLDPFNPDTDGDGLLDGEEVRQYGTDPRNRDTDGDTLSDGTEAAGCTSPINPDTDGDGIPDNQDPDPCAGPTPTATLTSTRIPTAEPPPTATPSPSPPPPTVIIPPPPPPVVTDPPPPPPPLPSSTTLPLFPTESPTP